MEYFIECPEESYAQKFEINKKLFEGKSKFQDILIFENTEFGRILALDGIIQTSEVDEFVYHEMLAHVPLFAHGQAKNILVIGGGDGGILREILRHKSVEHVTQVELDEEVITICKDHLPKLSNGAFDDKRLKIIIGDGYKFVHETDQKFDIIINDSTDPIGPGKILFTENFFRACQNCLTEKGIFVNQNGVLFSMFDLMKETADHLSKTFKDWHFFHAHVPIFVCGVTMFAWASNDKSLRTISQDTLEQRYKDSSLETKYYSPEIHKASFAIPQLLKNSIGK